ncbi:hypothetical protein CTAYLR_001701 [Chrysophaeum taylorii]|uniref:EF-hand domain-containing protein n=1 Tax=Chrysophaeum taylorii TaxID=2483200 RepID=A0AAD7XEU1_9STRA|nr:hypothetical protein CTAYLR_001701 [Chrysophaeum taylorii]
MMGNAAAVPESIDKHTARALVGSEKRFAALLGRAPWVATTWRQGKTISASEARLIWERDTFVGAARASLLDHREGVPPVPSASPATTLEVKLYHALAELKALRPLRGQLRELPLLRGKLRKKTEDCDRLEHEVARLERNLREEQLDGMALRWRVAELERELRRRTDTVEQKTADNLQSSKRALFRHGSDDEKKTADSTQSSISPPPLSEGEARIAKLLACYEDRGGDLATAFRTRDASGDAARSATDLLSDLKDIDPDFATVELDDASAILKRFGGRLSPRDLEDFVASARVQLRETPQTTRLRSPSTESDVVSSESPSEEALSLTAVERKVAQLLAAYEGKGGDLARAFRKWDVSGDGELSAVEIHDGLIKLGHGFETMHLDDIKALLKQFDKTSDGHLSLLEFESFVLTCREQLRATQTQTCSPSPGVDAVVSAESTTESPSEAPPPSLTAVERKVAQLLAAYEDKGGDLARAFRKWDVSGDGELSASEIHEGLIQLGHGFEQTDIDDIKALLKRFDMNANGHLTLLEFESFVVTCRGKMRFEEEEEEE